MIFLEKTSVRCSRILLFNNGNEFAYWKDMETDQKPAKDVLLYSLLTLIVRMKGDQILQWTDQKIYQERNRCE